MTVASCVSLQGLISYIIDQERNCPCNISLWFDGEFDGNQTEFELLSNNGKIAVIAKSAAAAHAMLMLLRLHIDRSIYDMHSYFRDMEWASFDDIDLPYVMHFPVNDPVQWDLQRMVNGNVVTTKINVDPTSDTDIWSLRRFLPLVSEA